MYGGRVIDDFDRRIVATFMDEFMGDFLFDTFQVYHFYHDNLVDFRLPKEGTRDQYLGELKFGIAANQKPFLKYIE